MCERLAASVVNQNGNQIPVFELSNHVGDASGKAHRIEQLKNTVQLQR